MKKEFKSTQGVMVNVSDDIQLFTKNDKTPMVEKYLELIDTFKDKINEAAALEEIILQERCLNSDLKIKLSFLRNYVYARCPFFRKGKSTKDIRVLVGRIDLLFPGVKNPLVKDLYKNEPFMQKTVDMLVNAMMKELNDTTIKFINMYDNS